MADSGALRQQRYKRHRAGDHSLCRRCDGRSAVAVPSVPGDARVDPGASLEALAARLEAAHEADPGNAQIARELRATLMVLRGEAAVGNEFLAEFGAA
jgi:hypothetical protein